MIRVDKNNGLITMRFEEMCTKLPLHVHPFSDRIILIMEGAGNAHYFLGTTENFDPEKVQSASLEKGDFVCFGKNIVHTFSTSNSPITTLTFHQPFIEFDDHDSFEKLSNWYPTITS